jgi:sugar phosphate isomerase/epimerase
MAVSLGLTPDGGWSAPLEEILRATAQAGFSSLGLSGHTASAEVRAAYAEANLACEEILALVITDDEASVRTQAQVLAEAASTMGAPFILTVYATPLTDASAALIKTTAEIFATGGARMAVEFSPLGPIATLPLALEVVEAAGGSSRAGAMIDSWHFLMGESRFADLESIALEEISYVQFSDALPPESEKLGRETMKRRALPGEGILELDRFATTLLERGFDGLVSLEILSEVWRERSVSEFASAAYQAAAPYWY